MENDYLAPHQEKALRRLANGKILWGGVGTGKSRVAVSYYMDRERPRDVYVITTAKKRDDFDWQEEFYRVGVGPRSGPSGSNSISAGQSSRRNGRANKKRVEGSGQEGSQDQGVRGLASIPDELDRGLVDDDRGRRSDGAPELLQERDQSIVERHVGGNTPKSGQVLGQPPGKAEVYPYILTVDSWNNIAKYADVADAFFIFDEQRLVGSGNWTRKFLRIAKRNRWILLSGTPGDTWMDYVPIFVANNFYKNRTEFKREHVVYNTFTKFPKVDRYINVGKLARHRASLLVEMPYVRHTRRRIVEVPLRYDKDTLERVLKKRWHVYEDRPLRDVAEMFLVARRVVNSDPSRLEMVCELWKQHPKLIVFYNFNFELESLRSLKDYYGISTPPSPIKSKDGLSVSSRKNGSLLPSEKNTLDSISSLNDGWTTGSTKKNLVNSNLRVYSSIAEWNGHKHQPVPDTKRWLYLVQYTAGAEGWNCTETDAMVMYSRNYSWKVTEQAYGRIDRLNTPFNDLWYYDFTTDSFVDRAIGRSLKAKETFNEAKYVRLFQDSAV